MTLLREHRFLTTRHVTGFCFDDHASAASGGRVARGTLQRLHAERLIERAHRRIGGLGAGSEAHIWMLTGAGHRLLGIHDGTGAVVRVRTPGERFIAHHLAVADTRLAIVTAERAGRLSISQLLIEPECWQSYTELSGAVERLKPDLSAITVAHASPGYEDHYYLEVDLATESIPVLLKQCRLYMRCHHAGTVQADRGVFPIVIWIVPTTRRADNVRHAIARARDLDDKLFRVCLPHELLTIIEGGG